MDPAFSLDGQGQLLVWFGPPGTGKSYALGALAYQWREHASFHYIADPEAFLGDVGYLLEFFIIARPSGDKEWRVAVLEDTGELFGSDARRQTGQGLARLLNAGREPTSVGSLFSWTQAGRAAGVRLTAVRSDRGYGSEGHLRRRHSTGELLPRHPSERARKNARSTQARPSGASAWCGGLRRRSLDSYLPTSRQRS
jgi:hypothetical protein